jgi:NAD(P)-dependent dehydrogenase (short-subunit alcohol dehydrogenase family)
LISPKKHRLGRIDVVVSNAGYGLFGAAEELTDTRARRPDNGSAGRPLSLVATQFPSDPAATGGLPTTVVRRLGGGAADRLRRRARRSTSAATRAPFVLGGGGPDRHRATPTDTLTRV